MKFNYFAPTPKWARKLGDGLLAASTTITATAIVENNHTLALIALGTGVFGKFLTNMFAEDEVKSS